jgi:hypothetical protein
MKATVLGEILEHLKYPHCCQEYLRNTDGIQKLMYSWSLEEGTF